MTYTSTDFTIKNKALLKRLVKQAYSLYDYTRGHTSSCNKAAYEEATKIASFLTYKYTKLLYEDLDAHFCSCGNLVLDIGHGCSRICKDMTARKLEKTKQTCLKKYGTEHHLSAKKVISRRKKTCLEKYGVDNVSKAQEVVDKIRKKITGTRRKLSEESRLRYVQRVNETRKKNGTYAISYAEDFSIELLKTLGEVKTQYSSEEYPFLCDAYLPKLDLYIELNYHWTHGGKPFDKFDIACLRQLRMWKKRAKSSSFFRNALDVWTNRDVKKLSTAKKRALNYKAFYSYKEFCKWYKKMAKLDASIDDMLAAFSFVQRCHKIDIPRDLYDNDMFKYHYKTIIRSRVKDLPTLKEAAINKELIMKAVHNCLKYMPEYLSRVDRKCYILKRFTIAKIAPLPTMFQPSLAKRLIETYANNADVIIDPFSGFSGRLLGTVQAGKKYIGYDINKSLVKQSNRLIRAKKLKNCSVKVEDVLSNNKHKADALLTCPPYNLKETWGQEIEDKSCDEWIDIVLKKYRCKTYIFVVDKTIRYKKHIKECLSNGHVGKHINKSCQYVIVIRKD